MIALPKSSLSLGDEIGSGGQSHVFEILDRPHLVYKEYHPKHAAALNEGSLAYAVTRAHGLRNHPLLAQGIMWPRVLVKDQGALTGFCMQRLPDRYCHARGDGKLQTADIDFAFHEPTRFHSWMPRPDPEQLRLLAARIAQTMAALHDNRIAMNDVSGRNVLYSLEPNVQCTIVDADSFSYMGVAPVMSGLRGTPNWDDPLHDEEHLSFDRDRYKLAVLIARLFTRTSRALPDPDEPLPIDRGIVDLTSTESIAVQRLMRQAGMDLKGRPHAAEWVAALSRTGDPPAGEPPQTLWRSTRRALSRSTLWARIRRNGR